MDRAIEGLTEGIANRKNLRREATTELQQNEQLVTSVQPTVTEINATLASFGFTNFKLATAGDRDHMYRIVRVDGTDVSILVGSKSHDQAPGLSRLWEPLAGVLLDVSAAGQDVLVDAGRLGLASWPRPLAAHSDLTVLMSRSSLPGLVAARSWAATLADDVLPGHEARLLIVGEGRPYGATEASRTLGLPVLGSIDWDPVRASVFSDGSAKPRPRFGGESSADRAFEHSGYLASLRAVGEAIRKVTGGSARDAVLRGMIAARTGEGIR